MKRIVWSLCVLAGAVAVPVWADRSYTDEEIEECREAQAKGGVTDSFCERLLRQEGSGPKTDEHPRSEHDENDSHHDDCIEGEDGCVVGGGDDTNDSRRAERLDERGDRREERLDDRADRADERGNEDRADRLEDRGDAADERLDNRSDAAENRKDNRDDRHEGRQSRRSGRRD